MISTILIIGGGQAGAQAIDTLRREGFGGRLVLIGDEPELPLPVPAPREARGGPLFARGRFRSGAW